MRYGLPMRRGNLTLAYRSGVGLFEVLVMLFFGWKCRIVLTLDLILMIY